MVHTLKVFASSILTRQPTTTVLFVTNRCNLDCKICFYTARERRHELSSEEFARLARSMPPQWYVMFTGGEPFIRPDLPEIASHFYDRGAANLHVASNCTYLQQTVSGIARIASYAHKARVILVTSIDGPAHVHDRIRESTGAYEKTVATVRSLLALKADLPNLTVAANFTFCALNQYCWRETVDQLRHEVGVDAVNIGLIRGTPKERLTKCVDLEEYRRAARYLSRTNDRDYFSFPLGALARFKEAEQADIIYRVAKRDFPAYHRCLAGRVFHVITETGDVYPCEMLKRKIGNLREVDMDFRALVHAPRAKEITDYIDQRECLCTYECAIGPSLAGNPAVALRFAKYLASRRVPMES